MVNGRPVCTRMTPAVTRSVQQARIPVELETLQTEPIDNVVDNLDPVRRVRAVLYPDRFRETD